jgi:hypothetical protein
MVEVRNHKIMEKKGKREKSDQNGRARITLSL